MPFNFQQNPIGEAALDSFNQSNQKRLESKLSLQMLSSKLGMEAQQKQGELQFQSALGNLPPAEMSAYGAAANGAAQALQNGSAMPAIDLSQFKTTQGQQAAQKLTGDILNASAASMKMNHPVPVTSLDANGNKTTQFFNPRNQQPLGDPINEGPTGPTVTKLQAASTQFNQIHNMAQSLKTQLIGDGTPQNPGIINADSNMASRLAQGAQLTMGDVMKSNSPAAKAFMDSLPSKTIMYSKIMNGSGRPPSAPILDLESGRFFKPTDSVADALQKINSMDQDGLDLGAGAYQASGQKLPAVMAQMMSQRMPQQQTHNPLSGITPQSIQAEIQRRAMLKSQGQNGTKSK